MSKRSTTWATRGSSMYKLLKETADVTAWSECDPDPSLARAIPIRQLSLRRGQFPLTGTLIIVGFWFH